MSNTFYVLKDKKYGSYVGDPISYVSRLKDARRFSDEYSAREACRYGDTIKANASLLTGGLHLVKVTETPGEPKRRLLSEFDVGKPTDTIGYVLFDLAGYVLNVEKDNWYRQQDLDEATLFVNQEKAINAHVARSVDKQFKYTNIGVRRIAISAGEAVYKEEVLNA
jgi:hypothetical protein